MKIVSLIVVAVVGVVVGVPLLGRLTAGSKPSKPAVASSPAAPPKGETIAKRVRHRPELAAERAVLVQKLMRENVVRDVKLHGTIVKAKTTPAFVLGDFEDKQSIAGALLMWGLDSNPETFLVEFIDPPTNKVYADYSAHTLRLNIK